MTLVFLGVGGNASDTTHLIFSAYEAIAALPGVDTFEYSQLYVTSPVSTIPQPDFLNSVIRLTTSLTAEQLLDALQKIEKELGKVPKGKEEPRPIDLDILLFGEEQHQTERLTVPHPHWKARLFVLTPLSELTEEVKIPGEQVFNVKKYLVNFENRHNERVRVKATGRLHK